MKVNYLQDIKFLHLISIHEIIDIEKEILAICGQNPCVAEVIKIALWKL